MKLFYKFFKIDFFKKLLDTTSTHLDFDKVDIVFIVVFKSAILDFIDDGTFLKTGKNFFPGAIIIFELFDFFTLRFFESFDFFSVLVFCLFKIAFLNSVASKLGLSFEVLETLIDFFLLDIGNNVTSKVNNFFNILDSNIKKLAESGWSSTHEPNVRYRSGKGDMPHTLAASNTFSDNIAIFIDGSFARANTFEFWIVWINIL